MRSPRRSAVEEDPAAASKKHSVSDLTNPKVTVAITP
jgi:hypothetical protein